MYAFERLPRADQPRLNDYRVVDVDRALRLDLRRRDQMTDQYWFWYKERCIEFFVQRSPPSPGSTDIHLSVLTTRLIDRNARTPVEDEAELRGLRLLIREAIVAFWTLRQPGDANRNVILDLKF